MFRAVLFLLLALSCGSLQAIDYVLGAQGYYYSAGVPFTRVQVRGYDRYGCPTYSYAYQPVANYVPPVAAGAATYDANDMYSGLLSIAKDRQAWQEQRNTQLQKHAQFRDMVNLLGLNSPAGYGVAANGQNVAAYDNSLLMQSQQGSTIFGYNEYAKASTNAAVNVNELFNHVFRMADNVQNGAEKAHANAQALVGQAVEGNREVAEIEAKARAVIGVMSQVQPQNKFSVERRSFGTQPAQTQQQWQPMPNQPQANVPQPPAPQQPLQLEATDSVVASSCAKCHDKQNPDGNVRISLQSGVTDKVFAKSFDAVVSGKMPPPNSPQLSNEQAMKVLEELSSIRQK